MREVLTVVAVLMTLLSPVVYVRSILRGESIPHRTTRLVLLVITVLTSASLVASGDWSAAWLSLAGTAQAVVVFVMSLRRGTGGWSPSDISCLTAAVVGVGLWQWTDDPTWALTFAIFADLTGVIPTVIKTWHLPHTEAPAFYAMDAVAGVLVVLATPAVTYDALAYPVYIVAINAAVALLASRKPHAVPST